MVSVKYYLILICYLLCVVCKSWGELMKSHGFRIVLVVGFVLVFVSGSMARASLSIEGEYEEVRDQILALGLPRGTENSLLSKLDSSLDSLLRGSTHSALNKLDALMHEVEAQAGKNIPEWAAEILLDSVSYLYDLVSVSVVEFIDVGVTYNNDFESAAALTDIALTDVNDWLEANRYVFRLRAHYRDNMGSDEVSLSNVVELHDEGIDIVVGHPYSTQCEVSLDYVNGNDMLLLSSSSTSPFLEIPGDNLLRACPPDSFLGGTMAEFYKANGVKAVAFLYVDEYYLQWLVDAAVDACGEEVAVVESISFEGGTRDFSGMLHTIDSALAEYMAAYGLSFDEVALQMLDFGEILYAVEEADFGDYQLVDQIQWYADRNLEQETLMRISDQAALHKLFKSTIVADVDSLDYQSVAERYHNATGSDLSFYSAVSYDSYWMLANAIIHAGSSDAMAVKGALQELYPVEGLPEPMTALSYALTQATGDPGPYDGISGLIGFDENGDRVGADVQLTGYAWVDQSISEELYGVYDESSGSVVTYSVEEQLPEYVTIGVTSSTTVGMSSTRDNIGIAKADINQRMSDEGRGVCFRFHVLDNEGNVSKALENIQSLEDMGINLVIGHGWSSQCLGSLDYVNTHDMLMVSSSSTSVMEPLIQPDNLYRLTTNDEVQGRVLSKLYEEHGEKAVIILYRDDAYGVGLKDVLIDRCNASGISVLGIFAYDPWGSADYEELLTEVEDLLEASIGPDLSLDEIAFQVIAFSESIQILNAADPELPLTWGVDWYGCDGTALSDEIARQAFKNAVSVKLYSTLVAPIYDDPLYLAWAVRYGDMTNLFPGFFSAVQYDIAQILAQAVIDAGSTDTDLVEATMLDIVQDYHGVSGYSTFDVNGDRIGANYDVWIYMYDGIDSYVQYAYYDLETDSIWFNEIPEAPALAIFNEEVWSWNGYHVTEPWSQWPEFNAKVTVWSEYYYDPELSVTVTFPDGTVYDLTDDEEVQGDPPGNGNYAIWLPVDDPQIGEYTIEASDNYGNTESVVVELDSWLTDLFDYITPEFRSVFYEGEPIEFTWSYPVPDTMFAAHLWNDDVDYWIETGGNSVYFEEYLDEGRYEFAIDAWNDEGGHIAAFSEFLVGSQPIITDTGLFTWMNYRSWEPEDKWYNVDVYATVLVEDYGLIDYITAVSPDGTEYEMIPSWDEYSPIWDIGSYYVGMEPDDVFWEPVEIYVSYMGEEKSETVEVQDWLLDEFSYVEPAAGSWFESSDSLVFSWDIPTDVNDYGVGIWNDDEFSYDVNIEDTYHEYDGESLSPGMYRFSIRAHTEQGSGASVEGYFFIGDPFQIYDSDIWSGSWYREGEPDEPIEFYQGFRVNLFAAENPEDVLYVKVIDPNGAEVMLSDWYPDWDEPEGDGVYVGERELDEPVSGDYQLVAEHAMYGVIDEWFYFDGFVTTKYTGLCPAFREVVSASGLVFSWENIEPDFSGFQVNVWDNDWNWIWEGETEEYSLIYDGPVLGDGIYWFNLDGWTDSGGSLTVESEFAVGEQPVLQPSVWSTAYYYLDDPGEELFYDLQTSLWVVVDDYSGVDYVRASVGSATLDLWPCWEPGDPPSRVGEYFACFGLSEPYVGEVVYEVSYLGEVCYLSVYWNEWLETGFTNVVPGAGAVYSSSDDLVFCWDYPLGDAWFRVDVWDMGGDVWGSDDIWGTGVVYGGDVLPDGFYEYRLLVKISDEAELATLGSFIIDSAP